MRRPGVQWQDRQVARPLGSPPAYLRGFEPLVAFPDEQREYYSPLRSPSSPGTDRRVVEQGEREAAIAAAVRPSLELPDGPVLIEQVDGLAYVCPMQTRLRALVAAGEFRDGLAR